MAQDNFSVLPNLVSYTELHRVNLNVHFEASSGVRELRPDVVLKQVSDSVELHDVLGLALQPELVKFNE